MIRNVTAASGNNQDTLRQTAQLLQHKREKLLADFLEIHLPDFMDRHTRVLDDYFRESFESSLAGPAMDIIRNPYVMIALGGYGRQEQCIHSDIDLLILFKKRVPSAAEELIREIVYPLWDLGFEVGYATRSMKECISLAGKDYEVLTSLLDARFICGASLLYTELLDMFRKKVLLRHSGKIIDWLVARNLERHKHFGDSSYLLEPNLKEGQGGLRDYHTMLWIGKIRYDFKQRRDFEYTGQMSHNEYQRFTRALAFIWQVRSRLHHLAGRKCDQLHLEYQVELAEELGFEKANGQKPVELFLGKLHGRMEFVKQRYLMYTREQGYSKRSRRGRKPQRKSQVTGLEVRKDLLAFKSPEKILETPELLMKIFEESARLKIALNAEAQRLVREFGYLVDDEYRSRPDVVKAFERILMAPSSGIESLSTMLNTGLLLRLIPEFKDLVNRIQYNEYHIYPVDKHSLRTVQMLKSLGTQEDSSDDFFDGFLLKEIKNRKRLYWAALLHDIGKGQPGGRHSKTGADIVQKRLSEFGYREKDVDTVATLVRDHLLLVKTATRRDLNDEGTAIACARHIKDVELLKMLYLLTVADSMATGPKAWNEWSAVLLRELFLKVLSTLARGELASDEAVNIIEGKKAEILNSFRKASEREDMAAMFEFMSPRYLLYMPGTHIREHAGLYRQLGEKDFVWDVKRANGSDTRTVILCAKDRPGLFSKITGVFTLNGIDILDAQIFTWRNKVALDIFEVKPPPDQIFEAERWRRAEGNLRDALNGTLDITQALKQRKKLYRPRKPRISMVSDRVVIDNKTSSFFTIVEVFTYDFPGLLFCVTDALFRCGLDIWVSKIATRIDQVVDVFYVRDLEGQKITDEEKVAAIESAILEVLPGGGRRT